VTSAFSPPLAATTVATDRIRVTIDTATSPPAWHEIDAVGLVGPVEAPGYVIWMRGQWTETGTRTECLSDRCVSSPWADQSPTEWSLAFNTATGELGATPGQVK
jgi:hypothetical protein